jgi:gliding motility-associated-like protein
MSYLKNVWKVALLSFSIFSLQTINAQIIFSDDFESGTADWTLNSGGFGDNAWVVNNSYSGLLFNPTPNQPVSISFSPNSNYLHITNQTVCGLGLDCQAVFDAGSNTDQTATMTNNISTLGLTGISIDFYYLCNGAAGNSFGNVEYSTDNGITWLPASPEYSGVTDWTFESITNPAWLAQAQLKFRFRWRNNATGVDPSFAIDDFFIRSELADHSITLGTIVGSPFCPCETIEVPFTSTGVFGPGNLYTVMLSDATGSFEPGVSTPIGGLMSGANSGVINATIPCDIPPGDGYRIRIISLSTATVSQDNGIDLTIGVLPSTPTASVTVQPSCTTPTGTIVVTAPTGANIQYSIGGAYQTSGTFNDLAAGNYTVTAQDISAGCTSMDTLVTVITPPGAPVSPTATVTVQPDCTTPTGTIVVTAPTGANIQYSIGGAYQASGTFTGLAANTYSVTAQDINTGCTSSATILTVNTPFGAPPAPTASVTVQPTCAAPTGTIVVTEPTGANIQYSVGGAYQASGTFSGLVANTYNLTAQDINTGCTSSTTSIVINPPLDLPQTPIVSVTQGTCDSPFGTISIEAPILIDPDPNIYFTLNGEQTNASIFNNLSQGNYEITLVENGCSSENVQVNIYLDISTCEDETLLLPNVFTPNEDGINDEFKPINNINVSEFDLAIFNRWGNLMFASNDITKAWNGKANEKHVSEGVYFWKVNYVNQAGELKILSGNVTLMVE